MISSAISRSRLRYCLSVDAVTMRTHLEREDVVWCHVERPEPAERLRRELLVDNRSTWNDRMAQSRLGGSAHRIIYGAQPVTRLLGPLVYCAARHLNAGRLAASVDDRLWS